MEVRHRTQRCHLLDRLMGRSILANADAVMRKYIGQRHAHQCRQSCHRFAVITEYKEGRYIRTQTAVQHDAISDRCHRKFADTEVQVTSSSVLLGEVARILHVGLVGRCQVSRTAKQVRQNILDVVDQASGDRTACFRFLLFCPESGVIFQRLARLCIVILVPERFHLRIFLAVSGKHHVPCSFYLCLLLCDLRVVFVYLFRYEERLFARPI